MIEKFVYIQILHYNNLFFVRNKLEKMDEKEKELDFCWNLTMRVALLQFNLFLVKKCS
jgi:hypothetical protein